MARINLLCTFNFFGKYALLGVGYIIGGVIAHDDHPHPTYSIYAPKVTDNEATAAHSANRPAAGNRKSKI
jgi:hypothetical protein